MQSIGIKRFNIRVYLLCLVRESEVILCTEDIQGMRITKFPGGGLELGEGILDCIHREAMEEMGIEVEVIRHFYTTDFFQRSAYRHEDQIISIYYLVRPKGVGKSWLPQSPETGLTLRSIPIAGLHPDKVSLPIDKVVVELLSRANF
jgi:8-oxo-dGTP diphosphatase